MMKRVLSILLSVALLISMVPFSARATDKDRGHEETQAQELTFRRIRIDAGSGGYTEKAIVEDGELYINAAHFSRYTRYRFDGENKLFTVKGQDYRKAIKYVFVDVGEKAARLPDHTVKLKNCFQVEGELYLPFCQMLPILNAEMVAVTEEGIYVSNNDLSLAEVLYDFDIQEYAFDLSREFDDNKWLLLQYVLPGYLFDSVTNIRVDRLDFIADSGTYEDYHEIFTDYLKDDTLFYKAHSEYDRAEILLDLTVGLNEQTEKLYNVVEWAEKLEETKAFDEDALVKFLRKWELDKELEGEFADALKRNHSDDSGVSMAEIMEAVDYVYTFHNHVEDNRRMLAAAYDLSGRTNYRDAQHRAAKGVYDLYGDRVALALLERSGKELLIKALEETAKGTQLKVFELTAQISGTVWELYIPGDTGDVSKLTIHAGVVNQTQQKVGARNLSTERSVEDFRLCLLLMLYASRECYGIMADTAEAYEFDASYYRQKEEKIENMIQLLYLVANNAYLDTHEHYDAFAEENRRLVADSGILEKSEEIVYEEMIGPDESFYLDYLRNQTEYTYYCLLDINQDGCMELLAMEEMMANPRFDLLVYRDGTFAMGYADVWMKGDVLYYDPVNLWIETINSGTSGYGGRFLYYLDEELRVQETSFGSSLELGIEDYNNEPVTEANRVDYEALMERYGFDREKPEVQFLPVP